MEGDPASPVDEAAFASELAALEAEALDAMAGGAVNEPLASFSAAVPPPVQLADVGGAAISLARFHAEVVDACVETMASLARDRALLPARERPRAEERILEQLDAILVTGPGCVDGLFGAWHRSVVSPDPWKVWAPVFALGCIEGGESLRAIVAILESLAPDARADGRVAAEALTLAPHADRARFSATLTASAHPIVRAIGVDLRARCDALSPEELVVRLDDASASVVAAALRAVACLPDPVPDLVGVLRRHLRSADAAVAWRAARILLLWGHDDPCVAVRGGELAELGAHTLEIFVLRGDANDLPCMEAWLSRAQITPTVLSAIARFGHVGAWAFLVHHLADDVLANDAATALEVLFGDRVAATERKQPRAWRAAIGGSRFDPGVRYRRGQPWRAEVVVAEWADGALPRAEVAVRADELVARARAGGAVELDGWTPDPETALTALGAAVCSKARSALTGRWS